MPANILQLLEFDKVCQVLACYAITPAGKVRAAALVPLREPDAVRRALQETSEMAEALARTFTLPLEPVEDVTPYAQRATSANIPLEPAALCRIAESMRMCARAANALKRLSYDCPALAQIGRDMPQCPELTERIGAALDRNARVLDGASPQLRAVRRRIRAQRQAVEQTLKRMCESANIRPHLQYASATICHDRYVLPVNAYRKHEVRGIVHGSSDSGATLYIEPLSIVEAGNALAAALGEEDEEVQRILWHLTHSVAAQADEICAAAEALSRVDIIRAKGAMSNAFGMCAPRISEDGFLNLQQARHPLLTYMTRPENSRAPEAKNLHPHDVVPLNIRLGGDFRILMITGPNTGGKTVALKTVGLLSLMACAGMNLPAEKATVPIFDRIFADIGDEQSLEQSLSTFSSHITRIIEIMESATERSLVLLDELGAGTDPSEGSALGEAILERLDEIRCRAIVVTHLGKLKSFATTRPGVENASMEFDLQTLRPTYHLQVGTVGSSNALHIAERLGMEPQILTAARALLDDDSGGEYGSIIDQVNLARQDAEQRRERLQYLEGEAARLKEQYEDSLRRLKATEDRRGADIGLKLREKLTALQEESERLHADLRYSHKTVARRVRKVRDGLRKCLESLSALLDGHTLERPLEKGDDVYVIKLHKWGTVMHVGRHNKRARVNVGNAEIDVAIEDLQPWGEHV